MSVNLNKQEIIILMTSWFCSEELADNWYQCPHKHFYDKSPKELDEEGNGQEVVDFILSCMNRR